MNPEEMTVEQHCISLTSQREKRFPRSTLAGSVTCPRARFCGWTGTLPSLRQSLAAVAIRGIRPLRNGTEGLQAEPGLRVTARRDHALGGARRHPLTVPACLPFLALCEHRILRVAVVRATSIEVALR
jgi:hypothetical protein